MQDSRVIRELERVLDAQRRDRSAEAREDLRLEPLDVDLREPGHAVVRDQRIEGGHVGPRMTSPHESLGESAAGGRRSIHGLRHRGQHVLVSAFGSSAAPPARTPTAVSTTMHRRRNVERSRSRAHRGGARPRQLGRAATGTRRLGFRRSLRRQIRGPRGPRIAVQRQRRRRNSLSSTFALRLASLACSTCDSLALRLATGACGAPTGASPRPPTALFTSSSSPET